MVEAAILKMPNVPTNIDTMMVKVVNIVMEFTLAVLVLLTFKVDLLMSLYFHAPPLPVD